MAQNVAAGMALLNQWTRERRAAGLAVITKIGGEHFPDCLCDACRKIRADNPPFVVGGGGYVKHISEAEAAKFREWARQILSARMHTVDILGAPLLDWIIGVDPAYPQVETEHRTRQEIGRQLDTATMEGSDADHPIATERKTVAGHVADILSDLQFGKCTRGEAVEVERAAKRAISDHDVSHSIGKL